MTPATSPETPLDRAHARAEATGAEADRLAFWSRLAEAELHLVLDGEDGPAPRLLEVEGAPHALAFDTALRLASFAGAAPTAILSGRTLAARLAARGAGLALNLGAPSEQLLAPDAMAWLVEALAAAPPAEAEARVAEVGPPGALPDALLDALDAKLRAAGGGARMAYLARATYEGGASEHVLAFVDAAPGAAPSLAAAVHEALALSGLEQAALDVLFLPASSATAAGMARHGLRIDLPRAAPRIGLDLGGGAPAAPDGGPPKLR